MMKTLSEKFAELSAETKLAEERIAKAQTEGKEWIAQRRDEVRGNVTEALERLKDEIASAPPQVQARFEELRSKFRDRLEEAKEQGFGDGSRVKEKFLEKQIEARAAIRLAIASTRLAQLYAFQAGALKDLAEIRAEQTPVMSD
jgi:sugar-specific transcriptional regulator TrmB